MDEALTFLRAFAPTGVLAVVVYMLTRRQDRLKERERRRVEEVATAFLNLAAAAARPGNDISARDAEGAFDRLQLYGTEQQISLALKVFEGLSKNESVSLESLLASLRDSIRNDLGLDAVDMPHRVLRFNRPGDPSE